MFVILSHQAREQHSPACQPPHWLWRSVPSAGGSLSSWAVPLPPPRRGDRLSSCHSLSAHIPIGPEHQVHSVCSSTPDGHYLVEEFFYYRLLLTCTFISVQELCLYTLGNICPESEVVKERLLAQGIIPALASCIQVSYKCNIRDLSGNVIVRLFLFLLFFHLVFSI